MILTDVTDLVKKMGDVCGQAVNCVENAAAGTELPKAITDCNANTTEVLAACDEMLSGGDVPDLVKTT